MDDYNEYDQRFIQQWGEAMYQARNIGASVTIHHDDYPRWTCRLWRDMPGSKYEVTATDFDSLGALQKALSKIKLSVNGKVYIIGGND